MKNITLYPFIKTAIVLSGLLLVSQSTNAQESIQDTVQPNSYKNSLILSLGSAFIVALQASLYYERTLTQDSRGQTFMNAGIGGLTSYGGEGFFLTAKYGLLAGKNKHHLETSIGAVGFFIGSDRALQLAANLGYRNQIPGGSSMFRAGVGYPEFVYLSFGGRF